MEINSPGHPSIEVLLHGDFFTTDIGSAGMCSIVLIRGSKLTLVDTGHVGRRSYLESALTDRGIAPADIDTVVLTHAHWDHCQNLDLFSNAQKLLHVDEMKYAHNPHRNDWATPRWTGAMLDFLDNVVPIEDGYLIEPGVSIMHTPGHSAGTMCVMVDTYDGPSAVAGDMIQNPIAALTRYNPLVFWSLEEANRSIERVVESAETIYPGHDRPFRLVGDTYEYLFPKKLSFISVDLQDSGVSVSAEPRPFFIMPSIEEQTRDSLS